MSTLPAISRFLAVTLGMADDAIGKGAVDRAIATAMKQEGIADQKEYARLFVSSETVRQRLTDAVVVGETWFFRDRGPFTCLARYAGELREARVLKILSAPCATGEEPYSIAMTLLAAGIEPADFAVDGVDVSVEALNKARLAVYGKGAFRGHIGADVARYFQETPQGRKVSDQVRAQVIFHQDNLVNPDSLAGRGPYAIIFCRNLLIYLTNDARRRVFERLDSLLLPGGLLFTGHTETIFWHQQGYLPLQWDRAFALRKPAAQPLQKTTAPVTAMKAPSFLNAKHRDIRTQPGAGRVSDSQKPHEKTYPNSSTSHTDESRQPALKPDIADGETLSDELIQEARLLADQGDMEGAVRLCQEYTRKVGPSAEAYCLMGVIRMAGRDMQGAEDFFLKSVYLDPGHYESLIHMSLIYREKGDKQKEALYRERAERKAGSEAKMMETSKTSSVTKADKKRGLHNASIRHTGEGRYPGKH